MTPAPIQIKSGDAEIVYRVVGDGPPVVLLHPFPVNHEFWLPVAEATCAGMGSRAQVMDRRR